MSYKKVLFCVPPFPNRYGQPTHPHTGIGYLSRFLNERGIETAVVDFRLGHGLRRLKQEMKRFRPDLCGVTMMTYYHRLAYDIVRFLQPYGVPVAAGGPHISTLGISAVEECGAAFGFRMEAEKALASFCHGDPAETIPGLIYRHRGELRENPPALTRTLDELPFPTYDDVALPLYGRKRIPIISSRGCPCQCTFCTIATSMGRGYRIRSARHVFSEIEYWYRRGYRDFDFQDDNFTLDKERVFLLFELIKRAGMKDLFMQCGNGIRADLASPELFAAMREVGFRAIAFGVESANDTVLKNIKKGETRAQIERAVSLALEAGLEVSLFFIAGLPGETAQSFKESLSFAERYPVSGTIYYNPIPFPGTELFDWVSANGLFLRKPQDYLNHIAHLEFVPVFATPDFSVDERIAALKEGYRLNLRIKRRDLERKLGGKPYARILSWLLYETPLNAVLFSLIRVEWVKRTLNFFLLKMRLRINL